MRLAILIVATLALLTSTGNLALTLKYHDDAHVADAIGRRRESSPPRVSSVGGRSLALVAADTVHWWQIAAAMATCLGAFAAAVSAWQSARAAKASLSASEWSRRALVLGLHPRLHAEYAMEGGAGGNLAVRVQVRNDRASRDLELEIRFRDGRMLKASHEGLGPAPSEMSKEGPIWLERWEGVLTVVEDETDIPWTAVAREIQYAALRWWDGERIGRWEELSRFSPGVVRPEVGPDRRIA